MDARTVCTTAATIVLLLLLPVGCMNNGIEWSELDYTRSKPDVLDLVGTWVPTASALRDMRTRGRYPIGTHEVRLAADGRCTIIGMPDWWRGPLGESSKHLESANGTWKIREDKDVFTIYVLEFDLFGDPDSGNHMEFERRAKPGA